MAPSAGKPHPIIAASRSERQPLNPITIRELKIAHKSTMKMVKSANDLLVTPQLDFDQYVKVMGSFITEESPYMKAYTKLEIKVDLNELYSEAHTRIEDIIAEKKG